MPPPATPKRFYSLDVLRGLGALGVVFYHWHEFIPSTETPIPEHYAFFDVFFPFYMSGGYAPSLFFALSGFIFFWLYSEKIAAGKISFSTFSYLRLSRLYPLHLATLLIVTAEQAYFAHRDPVLQAGFSPGGENIYHFILQLLMICNWWSSTAMFNRPFWSVSVEVLMYLLFFALWYRTRPGFPLLAGLILGGILLTFLSSEEMVGRGLLGFFSGGVAYQVYLGCLQRHLFEKSWGLLVGALIFLWIVIPYNGQHLSLYHFLREHLGDNWGRVGGRDIGGGAILLLGQYLIKLVLFSGTVLLCALIETYRGTMGRRLAFLGDISYSTYLIHFPLQLAFILVASSYGFLGQLATSKVVFLIFWPVLLLLSFATFHFFERPAQRWLRRWYERETGHSARGAGRPTTTT